MSSWTLAIDFGTSFTTAAIASDGAKPELVHFDDGHATQSRMPSLVLVLEDELAVGWTAYRQTALHADRVWWTPKRALGETEPRLFGGRALHATEAVAEVLRSAKAEATRVHGAGEPAEVRLTHPASWAQARQDALRQAAARAGIPSLTLVPEPTAAAVHFAGRRLAPGEHVLVYDLGGGTFDTAVLEHAHDGVFRPVGFPLGAEPLGGEVFDERLRDQLETQLRESSAADFERLRSSPRLADDFRKRVRETKEGLSSKAFYDLPLPVGFERDSLRATREELEALIRADLERSLEILGGTLSGAKVAPERLSAIYVTGGSTRIPLVTHLLAARFGADKVKTLGDPKTVVALGAVAWQEEDTRMTEPQPRRPAPTGKQGTKAQSAGRTRTGRASPGGVTGGRPLGTLSAAEDGVRKKDARGIPSSEPVAATSSRSTATARLRAAAVAAAGLGLWAVALLIGLSDVMANSNSPLVVLPVLGVFIGCVLGGFGLLMAGLYSVVNPD